MAVGAAIVAAAVIGAGSAYIAGEKQEKAAKAAAEKVERARAAEEAEALRIAQEARPEGEAVEGVQFGAEDTTTGSFQDFLQPRTDVTAKSGLGTATGTSGLGFAV